MNIHGSPNPDATCMCCFDQITADNYAEYQAAENSPWLPSKYCTMCIEIMLKSNWKIFRKSIEEDDCLRSKRRLLIKGPPINLYEPCGFPCPDDGEVFMFWHMSDNQEHSAKLEGSFTGQERQDYWELQKIALVGLDSEIVREADEKQ